nr:PREDICTED: uncharacterized protein LOC102355136 isoform X2 [Latimeria chalumnae]|eukprot:XP_014348021.1 PREDICTED: uncharacterized protein LOC102355136 isoform X2 [Latimeria chalumnae]
MILQVQCSSGTVEDNGPGHQSPSGCQPEPQPLNGNAARASTSQDTATTCTYLNQAGKEICEILSSLTQKKLIVEEFDGQNGYEVVVRDDQEEKNAEIIYLDKNNLVLVNLKKGDHVFCLCCEGKNLRVKRYEELSCIREDQYFSLHRTGSSCTFKTHDGYYLCVDGEQVKIANRERDDDDTFCFQCVY